jgi:hypothetical protein
MPNFENNKYRADFIMRKFQRQINCACCFVLLFLLIEQNAMAQSDTADLLSRPLFAGDSTIEITIEGPLKTIMQNRDEAEEFPATLRYTDGVEHVLDIKLRTRGRFRRRSDICNFAPLRVNFVKKQVEGTVFSGQNKIKLVTDCQSSRSKYEQYVLREYLAYKIFNLLSDRSFRVRLVHVSYIDTDRKGDTRDSYAFFIEDKDHIADRLGMELIEIPRTNYGAIDPAHSNLISVYQYLIANTDFSLVAGSANAVCCHNAIIYQQSNAPFILIPYDFDLAGLVNASYAGPNPKFKITRVTQRLYRGVCANNSYLDSNLQLFAAKRDDITRLIQQLDGLSKRSVKTALSFVDDFYKDISNPKSLDRKVVKKCT